MQNTKVYPIITLGLILTALAANHLISRVEFVKPRLLSIDRFPRVIGDWKGGPDVPQPGQDVNKIIPTAYIVNRDYSNPRGVTVNLTLVTATEYNDLHNPMHCLPAAGWQLGVLSPCQVGSDKATSTTVTNEGRQMEVLYWFTGSTYRHDSVAERFRALRTSAAGVSEGDSLLVRLLARKTPQSAQILRDFATLIEKPLGPLKEEARRR